jgi:hypothetical protein
MVEPDQEKEGFLVYLISVDNNSATYGIDTRCKGMLEDIKGDIRGPSLVYIDRINDALYAMDRAAGQIETWQQLYAWLGRGNGWALFSQTAGANLLPHWFASDVKLECIQARDSNGIPHGPFVDLALLGNDNNIDAESLENAVGASPDDSAIIFTLQLSDNMVITRQPLFI